MKGFILAAGLGTRLRPLTEGVAKPALPVLGVPTFWFGAWHMARELGITELAINCGHAPETLRRAVEDPELAAHTGIKFHVSDESGGILGSSGGVARIRDWVGDDTLAVFNGDCICFPDWKKLLKTHQKSKGAMTMHLRRHAGSAEAYTAVDVDAHGRVLGFGPKSRDGVMFTGAYILDPAGMKMLPAGASELMATLLSPLSIGRQLYGAVEDLPWIDTGTIATYAAAHFGALSALPAARELVDLKMREVSPGVFFPKSWEEGGVKCKVAGPAVFYGGQKSWDAALKDGSRAFGPRFIGFDAPAGAGPCADQIHFESKAIPV